MSVSSTQIQVEGPVQTCNERKNILVPEPDSSASAGCLGILSEIERGGEGRATPPEERGGSRRVEPDERGVRRHRLVQRGEVHLVAQYALETFGGHGPLTVAVHRRRHHGESDGGGRGEPGEFGRGDGDGGGGEREGVEIQDLDGGDAGRAGNR